MWIPWLTSAPPPSSASVPRQREVAVVLGRAVPLDARRGEQDAAEPAARDEVARAQELGLQAVLEQHAELHPGALGRLDQRPPALDADVDRLLHEHVPAAAGRGDALLGVQARGAADHDEVQRVREEAA